MKRLFIVNVAFDMVVYAEDSLGAEKLAAHCAPEDAGLQEILNFDVTEMTEKNLEAFGEVIPWGEDERTVREILEADKP